MNIILKTAAAAAFAAAATTGANATVVINSIGFDAPGYRTGKITHTPTNTVLNNIGIGRLALSGTDTATMSPVSYLTYCVDIFHMLHNGMFNPQPLSTYISNPVRLSQLTTLIGNANLAIAGAGNAAQRRDRSAAAQLAVWEIVFEGGSSYDLTAGQFRVSNGDSANARSLANSWLGNVTSGSWTRLPATTTGFLYSSTNQSQIFLSAVPEPSSWAMMILGFGMAGAAMRRRARLAVA